MAFGGNQMPFFPQLANAPDPLALPEADPESATALPPAGHRVVYNNTLGYFPYTFGYGRGMGMGGMGGMGGMMRPGTMGSGMGSAGSRSSSTGRR
jgi:hypothetical protein